MKTKTSNQPKDYTKLKMQLFRVLLKVLNAVASLCIVAGVALVVLSFIRKPSVGAVEQVRRTILTARHQWFGVFLINSSILSLIANKGKNK